MCIKKNKIMQINKNVRTFMICVKSNLKHTLSQTNYSQVSKAQNKINIQCGRPIGTRSFNFNLVPCM